MKIFTNILIMISLAIPVVAQEDIDPVIMQGLIDASKSEEASTSESKDPVAEALKEEKTPEVVQSVKQTPAIQVKTSVRKATKEVPAVVEKKTSYQITAEEEKMLEAIKKGEVPVELQDDEEIKKQLSAQNSQKRKVIYEKAPVEPKDPTDGYILERDSSKILTVRMNINDSISMKVCYNSGLTIALDEEVPGEFQSIRLDDKIYFDAQEADNKRGVYVTLKQPVGPNQYWESALRLVRKTDDKAYLINLLGVPCPERGLTTFPKVLYIKDHFGLIGPNNKILTPEDTIIQMSKGLPRVQKNKIRVYDMVASSSSSWAVFGLEVQYTDTNAKTTKPEVIILDNLQINKIPSKLQYLPLQSEKATDIKGVSTLRFSLSVNISKKYIVKNRYLHIMYLDESAGHYQYMRVDLLPYFMSLIKRGFEL